MESLCTACHTRIAIEGLTLCDPCLEAHEEREEDAARARRLHVAGSDRHREAQP